MSLRDRMKKIEEKTDTSDLDEETTPALSIQNNDVTIFPQLVDKLAKQFSDGKVPRWMNALIAHNIKDASDESVAPVLRAVIETMTEVLDDYQNGIVIKETHALETGEAQQALRDWQEEAEASIVDDE